MTDLIKREDAIRALQCVTDSPNFGKALGEIMRIPSAEQTEPQTCDTCRYDKEPWHRQVCDECTVGESNWQPKDEPQTERYCTNCKHNGVVADYECRECHGMDKHEFIEPQTEEWHDDCNTCMWHDGACTIPCCDYEPKDEPQTDYKKWETKPKTNEPTEITTCVGVAMALLDDEPQTDCAWK